MDDQEKSFMGTKAVRIMRWENCYESNWKGVITPESFAHPAKYSRSLIERIFQHCLVQGYVSRGDLVGDCFGGIGTGGVTAGYAGLRWIGCELEPRFVAMAKSNFALHADKYVTLGLPQPTIVQGDSRKFDEVVGAVAGVVCSPPYSDIAAGAGGLNTKPATKPGQQSGRSAESASQTADQRYGAAEGQISKLKEGSLSAVVTSPPFLATGGGCKPRMGGTIDESMMKRHNATADERYGAESGQIGNLPAGQLAAVVTSPPYADSVNASQSGIDWDKAKRPERWGKAETRNGCQADGKHQMNYGQTEGQIGALRAAPLDAVVTSPPFLRARQDTTPGAPSPGKAGPVVDRHSVGLALYGQSEGNIGNATTETYWQAMAQVYSSCFRAIKPGGVIVVVVKSYVKGGKIVDLPEDTAKLLEHCGFTVIERIHAMLVKETVHNDLFEGTTKTKKQKKSFFRRLAEKNGSPEINFEEVIIARKP